MEGEIMRLLKRESGKRKGFKTEVWYTPTWDQWLIPYLKSACMPGETIIFSSFVLLSTNGVSISRVPSESMSK